MSPRLVANLVHQRANFFDIYGYLIPIAENVSGLVKVPNASWGAGQEDTTSLQSCTL